VLTQREGIPISLAVLAVAVAARAGLPLAPLNVPMHVVCGLVGGGGWGARAQLKEGVVRCSPQAATTHSRCGGAVQS
jgi:hypothetical protein